MGPSGSGKSTLLNVMKRGSIGRRKRIGGGGGTRLDGLSKVRWRGGARHIRYVFQTYNLIPVLTAAEMWKLPLALTSTRRERADRVKITATAGRAGVIVWITITAGVRWPGAAGRRGARHCQRPDHDPRGRADRKPRSRIGRRHPHSPGQVEP
ncbi:MAG: ATP-binding cassette domain-containing protein [Nitrospiraceae bacterium]|nr:ATP-binding cassette domain-containing protein [Nitrospiraceae bacterium]